jgi:hypothetical protein
MADAELLRMFLGINMLVLPSAIKQVYEHTNYFIRSPFDVEEMQNWKRLLVKDFKPIGACNRNLSETVARLFQVFITMLQLEFVDHSTLAAAMEIATTSVQWSPAKGHAWILISYPIYLQS